MQVLERANLPKLLKALSARGYRVAGPTVREGAIVYDEIASVSDLPEGWTDEQGPGTYRLKKRPDAALFGYVVGPHSWKKFLFPPRHRLWQAKRKGAGFRLAEEGGAPLRFALLGVRSCELHALSIQDRVFVASNPCYRERRDALFVVAVNCVQAGGTCFCASMKTGPRAESGFDLCLTESIEGGRHVFLVEVGSPKGAELIKDVPVAAAGAGDAGRIARATGEAAARMGRSLDTKDLKEVLYRNYENPRWDDAAARCLTCSNCTMVCPTCFCSTVEDATGLGDGSAERRRAWDSCFTVDFSYIHGGSIRPSVKARYRQWMVHKLATWIDQFGTSGCVGCGRCITWCPVGIDITEEARAIRGSEKKG